MKVFGQGFNARYEGLEKISDIIKLIVSEPNSCKVMRI